MYGPRECESHEDCKSYLDAKVGANCSVCGMRRIPPGYGAAIVEEDAAVLTEALEAQRSSNPDLAKADAEEARVRFPRLQGDRGKV